MVALAELLMVGTRVPLLELHVCDGAVELAAGVVVVIPPVTVTLVVTVWIGVMMALTRLEDAM